MNRLKRAFWRKTISRPAFLLPSTELANHYEPIWDVLAPEPFDILLHGGARLPDHLPKPGWQVQVQTVEEAEENGDYYGVLVTNHPVSLAGFPKRPRKVLIKRLARVNIRMMYAAGKTGWNLSDWNRLYDGVMCFGPHHARLFNETFGLPVTEIGFPRFDKFFGPTDEDLHARFDCDPAKPTVVWLPTWKEVSSVGHFNAEIAALMPAFNVVVKVHPLMPEDDPERVAALRDLGFNTLITDATDNVPLYRLADYMLFDYGGPAFGAIYTGKRFVLLNVPGAVEDGLVGAGSPEIMLRETLASVDPGTGGLTPLLNDGPHWDDHAARLDELRRAFFAERFGTAAEAAAAAITDLSWLNGKGASAW